MTLSSDDEYAVCPECGRPYSDPLDLAVGLVWVTALVLASVALVLVIAYCLRALW